MNPNDINWMYLHSKVRACKVGYVFEECDARAFENYNYFNDLKTCLKSKYNDEIFSYVYVDSKFTVRCVLSNKEAKRLLKISQL